MKQARKLRSTIALLKEIEGQGRVEPGCSEAYGKALRRLEHAAQVGDHQGLLKAVNAVVRCFLRGSGSK